MLKLSNVTKTYKNGSFINNALDNVSTSFDVGDFVAILGESGSGKSTLLNVISGLDTATSGNITIDNIDTSKFSAKEWAIYRNHYVGFIFQEYNLIQHLSLVENVELPLLFQGVSKKEARKKALEKLDLVGLSKHVKKRPTQISGGQQQRTSIARALVTEPKIIMADEPTGSLDSELSNKIMTFLKKICSDKIVILVTHDEDLANKFANRIINIQDGKIITDSNQSNIIPKEEEKLDYKRPKMKFLTALKFSKNNYISRIFRSLLTSSIVSIGFIAIFLLTFIVIGINTSISDTIESFIPKDQYQIYHKENTVITPEEVERLEDMQEIDEIISYYGSNITFDYTHISASTSTIITILPENKDNYSFDQYYGKIPSSNYEIMVNESFAKGMTGINELDNQEDYNYAFSLIKDKLLTVNPDKYSDSDNINLSDFKIVGLYVDKSYNSQILITKDSYNNIVSELPEYFTLDSTYAYAYLNIEKESKIDDLTDKLNEDFDLKIININDKIMSKIESITYGALKVLIVLSAISLIVAGILIAIVIYTSVIERTKEIGILTSIGARQSNIIGIFLGESGLIGLVSSIIATVISILVAKLLNSIFHSIIENPIYLLTGDKVDITLVETNFLVISLVILFSIIFSMLCGLVPSLYTAKLKAVTALRKE